MFFLVCILLKTKSKTSCYFASQKDCDSHEKFVKLSTEYQNYLVARNYKPDKMKKQC